MRPSWAWVVCAACNGAVELSDTTTETPAEDLRLTESDFPAPAGGMTMWGPEVEIPAATDKMFCFYGTYHGPNVGIHQYDVYQGPYGHHMVLFESTVPTLDAADGDVEDCTDLAGPTMTSVNPLLFAPTFGPGENLFTMPDGMAVSLDDGDRWMIQAHYLNTSDHPILVRDAINLGLLPEAEVTTWAAPYAFTTTDLEVPVGESSKQFECSVEDDFSVMFLLGHMHEWGTRITIERTTNGAETLYDVDPWDASYRDAPPVNDYQSEPLTFSAGDTFRVTCNWNNDTDAPIAFPSEMCAASGMLYPSKIPVICDR